MASAKSSFNDNARAIVRLIDATSIECVRRVRKMVAGAVKENLRLVFKPPKRARMDDASPIALKLGAIRVAVLVNFRPRESPDFCANGASDSRSVRFHLFARLPSIARERFVLHRIIIRSSRSRASPDFAKGRRGEFSPPSAPVRARSGHQKSPGERR